MLRNRTPRRRWAACILHLLLAFPAFGQTDRWTQLIDQTTALFRRGKFSDALAPAQEAVKIAERTLPPDDPRLAAALDSLAEVEDALGKFGEAEALARRALQIRRGKPGGEDFDLARSLNTLAQIDRHQAKYAQARPLYESALQIYEKAREGPYPEEAAVRNNLGRLDFSLGDYDRAEREYTAALRVRETVLGPDHPDVSISLNDLGELQESLRNYAAAEPLYQRALAIRENALGADHPDVAQTLTNLANLYRHQGRYGEAMPLAERALRIDEAVFGKDHPYVASDLNSLAVLTMKQGQNAAAEQFYQRALQIRETALGAEHPEVAQTLNDLADLYRHQDRFPEAEQLYQRALRIDQKSLGPGNRYVGTVLNNLAQLYARQGKYAEAEPLARRALRVHEQALGPSSGPVAMDLTNLAAILRSQGKAPESEPLLQRALAIWERLGGTDNQEHLTSVLLLLATLHYGRGQPRQAEPLFARAFDLMFRQFQDYFTYGSEKDRLDFVERNADRFPLYFSFVERSRSEDPELAGRMYDLLLWQKGLVVGSITALRRQVEGTGDPQALALLDQLAAKRAQIAALLDTDPQEQRLQRNNMIRLEDEADALERALVRRSTVFAQHRQQARPTWQQVRAALLPGDAAVEIVRFPFYDGQKWTGTSHYLALVLTPGSSTPTLVPLGEAGALESVLLTERRERAQARGTDTAEPGVEPALDAGLHPYELLWKPLEGLLANSQRVFLAPDGVLNQVSPGLFSLPGDHLLLERYDLRLVSSTRELLLPPSQPAPATAVLIGAPDFALDVAGERKALQGIAGAGAPPPAVPPRSAARPREQADAITLPSLPGTVEEIQTERRLLQQAHWQVQTFTGARALEEVIKRVVHPRLLHVATHGFFLPDQPHAAGSAAGDSESPEDPMLRSGLFLAGADRALAGTAAPEGMDDGVLTAYEAAALNLQGTELVVLSACNTGQGDVRNGEGVFGLRRALQEAGAQAVMMSLWSVPDRETQELMALFYQKWLGGMGKHEALRQAQMEMRERVRRRYGQDLPYYWGAFVMVGR
jgi:CHAT domain-containing protein/Tfp pilus assembly protein PilF